MLAGAILEQGLVTLGELLAEHKQSADLVLVGGGALFLRGEVVRPTADLDVLARIRNGVLEESHPFPDFLVKAVRRVGAALDLPHAPRDEKDWLNPGPYYLVRVGLPDGFQQRLTARTYGALTIWIASRLDLVALKFFAATDPQRGPRRAIDVSDLRAISPTHDEVLQALRWCERVDGRRDFLRLDAAPLLVQLGIRPETILPLLDTGTDL